MNRLSHSRLGNISFIALVTISYFVPRSLRSLVTKYDIVPRAIKLISPRLSYDNLYILDCQAVKILVIDIQSARYSELYCTEHGTIIEYLATYRCMTDWLRGYIVKLKRPAFVQGWQFWIRT